MQDLAGGCQFSVIEIDAKYHDIVGSLIGHEQEFSRGINVEIARCFALSGEVIHQSQSSGAAVDGEEGNAVVSAIRGVEELSAGMHVDFSGVVNAGEVLGKSRNRIKLLKSASAWIVGKRGDRRLQFIDYVGELAVRMKGQMPRSGSGIQAGVGRVVRSQGAFSGIEAVNE